MSWSKAAHLPIHHPVTRFFIFLFLVITMLAMLAILIQVVVTVVAQSKKESVDHELEERWQERDRMVLIAAICVVVAVLLKTAVAIVAVSRMWMAALRVYFLLQILVLSLAVVLIRSDFQSAHFFLTPSAIEVSLTAILLLRLRRSGTRTIDSPVIVDDNAIEMHRC